MPEIDIDKITLPKYEKLKKYTEIYVEDDPSINTEINNMAAEIQNHFDFIPPIFSEYTISRSRESYVVQQVKESITELIKSKYPHFTVQKQQEIILRETQKAIGHDKIKNICVETYLVRWHNDTTFSILMFDTMHKKVMLILVRYQFNENGSPDVMLSTKMISNLVRDEFNSFEKKSDATAARREFQITVERTVLFVLAVSKFIFEKTSKIEYEVVQPKLNPNPGNNAKTSTKTSQKKRPSSPIVLSSKIKKYTITPEDIAAAKKKTYQVHKNSWYVRGYYQRFGKSKTPKYIPPRINKRDPDKLNRTVSNKYIIKDNTDKK